MSNRQGARDWLTDDPTQPKPADILAVLIDFRDAVTAGFDRMDGWFDRMEERFDRMEERFERMDERLSGIERRRK